MKTLLEDYKRKLKTVDALLKLGKEDGKETETIKRLTVKAGCYRTFITELERTIKPSDSGLNLLSNNCSSPLTLTYGTGYKTNKPLDQSGEYVDKAIADELLSALTEIIKTANPQSVTPHKMMLGVDLGEHYVGECGIPSNKAIHMAMNAIKKATK